MTWFNRLTIGKKLQIYALFVSLIFTFGGLTALYSVGRISGYIEHAYNDNMVPTVKISAILDRLQEHRLLTRRHIYSSDVEEMKKTRDEMEKIHSEIIPLVEAKDKYRLSDEEEKVFAIFANNLKPLFDSYHEILRLSEGFSKDDASYKFEAENRPIFYSGKDALSKLINMKENSAKADYEKSLSVKKYVWIATLVIIFGGIGIVIISSVFITRSISGAIKSAVNTVSTSSAEIAATVTQHERTATQQATLVSETTVAMDELDASSRQTSEQAASASTSAQKASTVIEDGGKAVRDAVESMNLLKDKIGVVADQILKLGEQTAQIGGIANIVKDLSSQINMLGLNAAVEAARAGEHGKGFAVVASEVRKLAIESKKSAEQASAIVSDIQKATNSTIMAIEAGTKSTEDVTRLARQVGELFSALSGIAGSVYENAQQVLLNTKQQSAAFRQIVEAINSINTGAKETAAGLSQTKTGIQKLNETAHGLKEIV
ncbi:MAG: hypothetical protein A2073_07685 [Deltaproteobacteria bacterium GWC2_42_11]|nr:MAG: hypothetical protein A2073_07685 [Deltaproteobacteria bacterium GWC2_42_11]